VKSTDECHKEPNKREKGREKKKEKKEGKRTREEKGRKIKEKGGKREGKLKNFLASIAGRACFGRSVAAGLPLNRRGGFCPLKPRRLQCPCS
jgi:hypothetical protein